MSFVSTKAMSFTAKVDFIDELGNRFSQVRAAAPLRSAAPCCFRSDVSALIALLSVKERLATHAAAPHIKRDAAPPSPTYLIRRCSTLPRRRFTVAHAPPAAAPAAPQAVTATADNCLLTTAAFYRLNAPAIKWRAEMDKPVMLDLAPAYKLQSSGDALGPNKASPAMLQYLNCTTARGPFAQVGCSLAFRLAAQLRRAAHAHSLQTRLQRGASLRRTVCCNKLAVMASCAPCCLSVPSHHATSTSAPKIPMPTNYFHRFPQVAKQLSANGGRMLYELVELLAGKPVGRMTGKVRRADTSCNAYVVIFLNRRQPGSLTGSVPPAWCFMMIIPRQNQCHRHHIPSTHTHENQPQSSQVTSNKAEQAQAYLTAYDHLLVALRQQGALLNAVKPEMLLEYDDFCRVLNLRSEKATTVAEEDAVEGWMQASGFAGT